MVDEVVSNATDPVSNQNNLDDVVKYETHQKLLGQHKKTKATLDAYEAELSKYRDAEAEREQSKLANEGQYKEALGLKDGIIEQLREQVEGGKSREADTWRLQSFYAKLPGKIKHSDYLAHAALDKILYDPETMSCDKDSVEAVVNDFMESHAHLVETPSKGKLPSESPNVSFKLADRMDTSNKNPTDGVKDAVANLFGQS